MNQNKNIPYYIGCQYQSAEGQLGSGLSAFNYFVGQEEIVKADKERRKHQFKSFIESRNAYLDSLHRLGDNWISGLSKQPTEGSIKLSKDIINNFGNWYTTKGYANYVYPKIIMSPTPSGGIAFEVELFPKSTAYFSILNNDIHFEIEKDGYFQEINVDGKNFNDQLLLLYQDISIDEENVNNPLLMSSGN